MFKVANMQKITIFENNNIISIKNNSFKFDVIDKKINEILKEFGCKYQPITKLWVLQKDKKKDLETAFLLNNISFEEQTIEKLYVTNNFNKDFVEEKMNKIKTDLDVKNPDFNFEIVKYQIDGVHFLLNRTFAILGDDLGLGKTVETVIALKLLFDSKKINKILIVVLPSTISAWQKTINVFSYDNPEFEKNTTIINYEQLRSKNLEEYIKFNPDIIVCDEASILRNPTQARTGLMKIKAKYYWLLSGEIVEKHPLDLFYIVNTFTNIFEYDTFVINYVVYKTLHFGNKIIKKPVLFKNLSQLIKEIEPYFLKRTREDVGTELNKINIIVKDIFVDLSKEQGLELQKLRQELMFKKYKSDTNMLLDMFQRTRLVLDDANYNMPEKEISSKKYDELKKLLNEKINEKLVVFTSYRLILNKLTIQLQNDGFKVISITSDLKKTEREVKIKEYKDSKEINILVTSDILAYGINLETTTAMVHYDLPLLASKIRQRTYRMIRKTSTTDKVNVYYLLTNTKFDETVKKILMKKIAYSSALTGEKNSVEKLGFNFSKNEMEEAVNKLL